MTANEFMTALQNVHTKHGMPAQDWATFGNTVSYRADEGIHVYAVVYFLEADGTVTETVDGASETFTSPAEVLESLETYVKDI